MTLNWNLQITQFLFYKKPSKSLYCIFFRFLLYFTLFFTSRNSKHKNLQVTIMKKLKLLRFLSFRFCPTPEMKNSEISEICLVLQILTVVTTQDLKTAKIWSGWKTVRTIWIWFEYDLKEKAKISEMSEFSILSYILEWERGNLRNLTLTSDFDSSFDNVFDNNKARRFFFYLHYFIKYFRQTLIFMWNSALWKKFNFCFSGDFY